MAEKSAAGGPQLRARLITVAFNDMPAILTGRKRISNLPAPPDGYIRTLQVNLANQCIELMVICADYEPLANLGDMPVMPAVVEDVSPPATKARKGKR